MWLLYLSSRTVLSYFCTLRRAGSPTMFPSTISISYSTMLKISWSSTVGISFIRTIWNWLGLSPSILLMNNLNNFEISPSSRWVPCKWRASPRKRHKLSLYRCLVFSSFVRQLIVWFLSRGSEKTAFLHPIKIFLTGAAITSILLTCRTSTLCSFFLGYKTLWRHFRLRKSFNFARSSWVHTSLDRSSRVLFSCV